MRIAEGGFVNVGTPCPRCVSVEKTKQGRCAPCTRRQKRESYAGSDRSRARTAARQWYAANKERAAANVEAWGRDNSARKAEIIERGRLRKYGLTVEQYRVLHDSQGGCCRICESSLSQGVHIDHDHATRLVRGLLCPKCNIGLGHFEDDPERLRKAAVYLRAKPTAFKVADTNYYRENDGRWKVSPQVEADIIALRAVGRSLARIAAEVGLSKAWVYIVLKRVVG